MTYVAFMSYKRLTREREKVFSIAHTRAPGTSTATLAIPLSVPHAQTDGLNDESISRPLWPTRSCAAPARAPARGQG